MESLVNRLAHSPDLLPELAGLSVEELRAVITF